MPFELVTVLAGFGAGITYSLTAFSKKTGQPFDVTKFLTTVAIGGSAGVVMAVANLPINEAYEYLVALGAVPVVENLLKAAWRKIIKRE